MRTATIPLVDSEEGHAAALARIRDLWPAEDGTQAASEREALVTLVRAYEEKADPWPALPPQDIVQSVMDSHGLSQADLVPVFGSKSQVSDFLAGRRRMTVAQAIRMRTAYHVPLELLLTDRSKSL